MKKNTEITTIGRSDLTVNRISELIKEHQTSTNAKSIIQLVNDYSLTEMDVDMLLEARAEYQAAPAKIRKLLDSGLKANQINSLYEARGRINSVLPSDTNGVTIKKLILVRDTFVGANYDADNLTEIVLAIFTAARERRPKASMERAIYMACDVANTWGVTMLGTILEIVKNYGVTTPE